MSFILLIQLFAFICDGGEDKREEFIFLPKKDPTNYKFTGADGEEKVIIIAAFKQIADNVRCNDKKRTWDVAANMAECKERCKTDVGCNYFAYWAKTKRCETYETCRTMSHDGSNKIFLYARLTECDAVHKMYTEEIPKHFPDNVVRSEGLNPNMFCQCTTRTWMVCGIFIETGSYEEEAINRRLVRDDPQKLLPFQVLQSVVGTSDTENFPVVYSAEEVEVFAELQILNPRQCITLDQCFEGTPPNAELPSTGPDDHSGLERTSTAQGMCPVGAHSFRPGEPIYILKRDDQLVQQGKPVPCISMTGLRTWSLANNGQKFQDPFLRDSGRNNMLVRKDYILYFALNKDLFGLGFCSEPASPTKKKRRGSGKRKQKSDGEPTTESEPEPSSEEQFQFGAAGSSEPQPPSLPLPPSEFPTKAPTVNVQPQPQSSSSSDSGSSEGVPILPQPAQEISAKKAGKAPMRPPSPGLKSDRPLEQDESGGADFVAVPSKKDKMKLQQERKEESDRIAAIESRKREELERVREEKLERQKREMQERFRREQAEREQAENAARKAAGFERVAEIERLALERRQSRPGSAAGPSSAGSEPGPSSASSEPERPRRQRSRNRGGRKKSDTSQSPRPGSAESPAPSFDNSESPPPGPVPSASSPVELQAVAPAAAPQAGSPAAAAPQAAEPAAAPEAAPEAVAPAPDRISPDSEKGEPISPVTPSEDATPKSPQDTKPKSPKQRPGPSYIEDKLLPPVMEEEGAPIPEKSMLEIAANRRAKRKAARLKAGIPLDFLSEDESPSPQTPMLVVTPAPTKKPTDVLAPKVQEMFDSVASQPMPPMPQSQSQPASMPQSQDTFDSSVMSSRSMSPRPASDETMQPQHRLNPLAPKFSPKSPRSTSPRSAPAVAHSPTKRKPKKPMKDASFQIDMDQVESPAPAPSAEGSKSIVPPASAETLPEEPPPAASDAEMVRKVDDSKSVPGSSTEPASSPSPAAPEPPQRNPSPVAPAQDVDAQKAASPEPASRSLPVENIVPREPSPVPPPKDPNAWQAAPSRQRSRGQSEPSSMEPSSIESEGTGKKKKKKGKKGSVEAVPPKPVVLSQEPPPGAKPKPKAISPGMFGALQQDVSPEGSEDGEPIPPAAAPEAAPPAAAAPEAVPPAAAAPEAAPPAAAPEAVPPAAAPEAIPPAASPLKPQVPVPEPQASQPASRSQDGGSSSAPAVNIEVPPTSNVAQKLQQLEPTSDRPQRKTPNIKSPPLPSEVRPEEAPQILDQKSNHPSTSPTQLSVTMNLPPQRLATREHLQTNRPGKSIQTWRTVDYVEGEGEEHVAFSQASTKQFTSSTFFAFILVFTMLCFFVLRIKENKHNQEVYILFDQEPPL